jgi:hypothetical protein
MTQEEKELLLKDLCTRLPYDVVIHYHWEEKGADGIVDVDKKLIFPDVDSLKDTLTELQDWCIVDWKPYLRPMSSMTDEESKEYRMFIDCLYNDFTSESTQCVYIDKINDYLDWLNSRHFDYRGLIEKGLALEAKEGMYDY